MGKKTRQVELRNICEYLGWTTLKGLALLFFTSIVIFVLVNMSPIDTVRAHIGYDVIISEEQRAAITEQWGLDRPPLQRYFSWLGSALRGDWGTSFLYNRPVLPLIWEMFKSSLLLMSVAWVCSGLFTFALGIVAAFNRGNWVDKSIKSVSLTLAATPSFWCGMVLIMIFSVWLDILPTGLATPAGKLASEVTLGDRIRHLILPVIALSLNGMANIVLHTREKMIRSLESEYSLFARARGESRSSIFWRHNLRNVLLPAVTLHFASFSELFGGSVFVETVFAYPGVGQAAVQAGLKNDVLLLVAIAVFATLFVFVGNITADILYAVIDPQIRDGYRA